MENQNNQLQKLWFLLFSTMETGQVELGGLMDPQPPNRFWQYQKDTNQGVEWMELNFFDYCGFQPKLTQGLTHAKNIGGECK